MATSHKVTDHFLTCSVCMEVFIDPCTLQCYHTFCRKCVVSFTKTQPEAIAARSIPCPFCSKMTQVQDTSKSVEEWIRLMKPSFMIQGLIDSFGPGTKDTAYCNYCKEEGETTPATAWCSDCDDALCERCARIHKRSTKKHDVIGLTEEVKVKRKRKVMCKEHEDEKVEFLCKDCKKAVCQKCCIIYHRKCELVVTIESEIPAMKTALTKGKVVMLEKHKESMLRVDEEKAKTTEAIQMYSQFETDIKNESHKAVEMIKVQEKKLLDQLKEMKENQVGQLRADIKTGEMAVQMYQQQAELIDQAVKSDFGMDVYEMYQSYESMVLEGVDYQGFMKNSHVSKISFKRETEKLSKVLSEMRLVEDDAQREVDLDLQTTPVLQQTIYVAEVNDFTAGPWDVKVLVVNGIDTVVVTDRINKRVKSFYNKSGQQCQSKLTLTGNPLGLAQLTHNQVAVTVMCSKQIVIVEVNSDLKLLSTITTQKQYYGIACLSPTQIAASSHDPACVDILDKSGRVLESINPVVDGQRILKKSYILFTTRQGNILVSD